jgi:hypothetical protein
MRGLPIVASLVVLMAGLAAQAQPPAPPPMPGCSSAESKQFDFWVGHWTIGPTRNPAQVNGESLIEKLYGGCAIRENWMPRGGSGGSLSSYVPALKGWTQHWIDQTGATVDFTGGWNGKAMVLTGVWPQPGHPKQMTRMTYTKGADGSVRQAGESSDDGGKTWTASFDLTYRPWKAS